MEKEEPEGEPAKSNGSSPPTAHHGALAEKGPSFVNRFFEGFRRDPNASITRFNIGAPGADGKVFDVEAAAQATADSPLARRLKARHLTMIAIGGSIGETNQQSSHLLIANG